VQVRGLAPAGGRRGLEGENNGERFEDWHVSLSVDIKEMCQGTGLTYHSVPETFDRPSNSLSLAVKAQWKEYEVKRDD
jgi:hypothetical protein